jgi:hypothetical protein
MSMLSALNIPFETRFRPGLSLEPPSNDATIVRGYRLDTVQPYAICRSLPFNGPFLDWLAPPGEKDGRVTGVAEDVTAQNPGTGECTYKSFAFSEGFHWKSPSPFG